jgi:hypothetical protein
MIVTLALTKAIASLVCSCQMISSPHPYGLACKNPHTHELLQPLAYMFESIHQGYRESYMLNMSTFMSF